MNDGLLLKSPLVLLKMLRGPHCIRFKSILTTRPIAVSSLLRRGVAQATTVRPLTLRDICVNPEQLTTDAAVSLLHSTAVERGIHRYVDPDTGFIVQTAAFLSKRECCGMSCRHCPHEHVNVDHSSRRRRR